MDLDSEELEATKKYKKKFKHKYFNTEYQEIKKIKKIYGVRFDFEIWEKGEKKENAK